MRKSGFLALVFALFSSLSQAGLLDQISNRDATSGLRQALEQGASQAVATLGVTDGFAANERFRIPLPESLRKIEQPLRLFGQGPALDELELALNRAAETAVAEARPLLVSAVRQMTVRDAKDILAGGDDSVTRYFRGKTESPLTQKFMPIVSRVTASMKLAERYNRIAGQALKYGLIDAKDARLEQFVAGKAVDALYVRIAEEERAIRQDPAAALGSLARKVFGALE